MKKISILSLDDSLDTQPRNTSEVVLRSLYDGVVCDLSKVAKFGATNPNSKLLLSLESGKRSIELFDLVKSKQVVTIRFETGVITVTIPITSATCEMAKFEITDPESIDGAIKMAVSEAISHIRRMKPK